MDSSGLVAALVVIVSTRIFDWCLNEYLYLGCEDWRGSGSGGGLLGLQQLMLIIIQTINQI